MSLLDGEGLRKQFGMLKKMFFFFFKSFFVFRISQGLLHGVWESVAHLKLDVRMMVLAPLVSMSFHLDVQNDTFMLQRAQKNTRQEKSRRNEKQRTNTEQKRKK